MNGIVLVFYYCIGKKTAHSGVVKKSRTEHFCSIRLGTGFFEELPRSPWIISTGVLPHHVAYGYAEWYKGFTSREIDSGSSPLVALAMASRENRKFMEPVRDWYRRYFDRVKQEA